jgi:hypothetical protein
MSDMRIDERGEGWQPVYIDPDFDELMQLAKSGWDTIRLMIADDHIFLASGYGNCHETIARSVRAKLGRRADAGTPAILFHQGGKAFINFCDFSGPEKVAYEKWHKFLNKNEIDMLRDLVRESGLSL